MRGTGAEASAHAGMVGDENRKPFRSEPRPRWLSGSSEAATPPSRLKIDDADGDVTNQNCVAIATRWNGRGEERRRGSTSITRSTAPWRARRVTQPGGTPVHAHRTSRPFRSAALGFVRHVSFMDSTVPADARRRSLDTVHQTVPAQSPPSSGRGPDGHHIAGTPRRSSLRGARSTRAPPGP